MRQRNQKTNALSWLWNSGRIEKILFFSYRFSFPWFHDQVLSQIRKGAIEGSEITVLASRFGDDFGPGTSGNLYDLDNWAKWQTRLRLRYLPSDKSLYHNKFILVKFAGSAKTVVGIGSANLTSQGWMDNLESWTWSASEALAPCVAFLEHLSRDNNVGSKYLSQWILLLKKYAAKSTNLEWLHGDKERARKAAFKALWTPEMGRPNRLLIVSPYLDESSADLLEEVLGDITSRSGVAPHIDIWVDGSASVSRKSDYAHLLEMAKGWTKQITFWTIGTERKPSQPTKFSRLHAKSIELCSQNGVRRIIGSANFTGHAWNLPRNTETVFLEKDVSPLESLLPDGLVKQELSVQRIKKLMGKAPEEVDETSKMSRWIYWAAFDESPGDRCIAASFKSFDRPTRLIVKAGFTESRLQDSESVASQGTRLRRFSVSSKSEVARKIVEAFADPKSWGEEVYSGRVVTKRFLRDDIILPERMRVVLEFADGTTIDAPVEPVAPDFENTRDPRTGIPLQQTLDNVLGAYEPFVIPISRKSTLDDSDDGHDNEEELEEMPPPVETLSDDPEYNIEPSAVKLAKRLKKMSEDEKERLKRQLLRISHDKYEDPKERLLVRALNGFLGAKKK